ncbi:hypothetical protein IH781_03840, partial [Patescibacteria group bacterium]|nr:hypothetical protein [Patescibacteria group bacterium]
AGVSSMNIFYNDSFFDGNDPDANAADDAAIATDKTHSVYGEHATFANYTSYWHGINGIMVDITDTAQANQLSLADFQFLVGNKPNITSWEVAPAPNMTVRIGGGTDGADRVMFTWANGTLTDEWLQVTVKPTVRTGLTDEVVFFYGNQVGDTGLGNSSTVVLVDSIDRAAVRDNLGSPVAIDSPYDMNRDEAVDETDRTIVTGNPRNFADGLILPTFFID